MRISTGQIHQAALKSLLDQQASLSKTQQQVATGKRILVPSDDPALSAELLGLDQTYKITTQYQENITAARTRLNREESTLASMTNILNRVRELANQGNNSTLTNIDRGAIAVEVKQGLNELFSLANTRDASGEYLFAGMQSQTQPFSVDASGNYSYNGDDGQRFIQIGPTRQVASGDSGLDVFQAARNGNGTFTTRDHPDNNGSGVIDPGSVTDPSAYDGDTYTISFPISTPAGATLSFSDTVGTDDDLNYALAINGTTVYSVSESGTPVNTLDGLAAVINDDSATTGVRAVVTGGGLYLLSTQPSSAPITVTETLSGASDGDSDTVTGYFGSQLTGTTTPSANLIYGPADADFYVVEDSAGNIETSGPYGEYGEIAFNGIVTDIHGTPRSGDSFTIAPSSRQDMFSMVGELVTTLEGGVGGGTSIAQYSNTMNRFLADIDQAMENINAVRARVGARLNAVDSQDELNSAFKLHIEEARSNLQDLDYASAITRLNQQMMGLEAAQKSFLQVQNLSLFNFL
ncbi:MAG: flagellar hook-associated protein FlgL [Gammaproteobacteria bacterium]